MAVPPPPPQATGYQLTDVELNDDREFVFTREDGPRPPVRSVDSAILRAVGRRSFVFNLAFR